MNNFKVSDHFYIAELVPKPILMVHGKSATRFIDERQILFLEFNRKLFGACTVNTWYEGGDFDSRGYRPLWDKTGGDYSQHRYGRATDSNYCNATAEEVRAYIHLKWLEIYFPKFGITRVESDVSWLHADQCWTLEQSDLIFVPVPKKIIS